MSDVALICDFGDVIALLWYAWTQGRRQVNPAGRHR